MAVRQMSAVGKIHAQHNVPWFQCRKEMPLSPQAAEGVLGEVGYLCCHQKYQRRQREEVIFLTISTSIPSNLKAVGRITEREYFGEHPSHFG